jgi:hypothetical protein
VRFVSRLSCVPDPKTQDNPCAAHFNETRIEAAYSRESPDPSNGSDETPFAAPHKPDVAAAREESDTYGGIVAVLNPKLRVIRGKCNLQWIAQRQNTERNGAPVWKSFAYCGTREGLLLRLPKRGYGCDPDAWAIIEALPDCFPKAVA